jgi:AcrR family transcriptional regulator
MTSARNGSTRTPSVSRTRARIDRAEIVLAARDLLDEEGPTAFTMARIGDRLGVTAMALYRHVADRRDLEHALVELVLADLEVGAGPAGDWAGEVAAWMRGVRDHLLRHPWVTHLIGSRRELSPPWLGALDRLVCILDDAGFEVDVVAREIVRITRATLGITIQEIEAPLPHAAANSVTMLAALSESARPRWRPIIDALAHYSDDDLFDDLVAATLARLRADLGVSLPTPT